MCIDVVLRELRENRVYTFKGVHVPETTIDIMLWLEDEFQGCEILGYDRNEHD